MLEISFLYPSFLWALLLTIIPIIIHLFNFRRFKTIYFSNVDLLKEIKEESKKSRNIKNWLILLFRILFITFLVLAFAFPIYGNKKANEKEVVSLYIDNSFSMDANGIEGNKLNNAKAFADQIIQSLSPNAKIHIITNDFEGNHQTEFNKLKAQEEISKIQPSSLSRSFENILNRQSIFFQNKQYKPDVYWISDFQQLEKESINNSDSFDIKLSLLKSIESGNISIDSVWFDSPIRKKVGSEELKFKITNHGYEVVKNLKIQLKINNRINSYTINQLQLGTQSESFEFQVPNDTLITGEISVEDENLSFDNKLLFSYLIPKQQKVYLIANHKSKVKPIIKKIFGTDSLVALKTTAPTNVDFTELNKQNLIILGELNEISQSLIVELEKLTQLGKIVAILPGPKINSTNYKKASFYWGGSKYGDFDTSKIEIGSIRKKHSFFKDVFEQKEIKENIKESFPYLLKHYSIENSLNSESIIYKENGTPYLVNSNNFYLFASGITKENSNFAQKSLIVPLMYQMLFKSINTTPIQYFIKSNIKIQTPSSIKKKATLSFNNTIYQIRIDNNNSILPSKLKEGNYKLLADGKAVGAFSLNQTREESKKIKKQLEFLDKLKLEPNFSSIEILGNQKSNTQSIINQDGSLWLVCLIIAICFLSLEMIFIRIKN